jgi:hypothetical protein
MQRAEQRTSKLDSENLKLGALRRPSLAFEDTCVAREPGIVGGP